MPSEPNYFHHGKILLEKFNQSGVTAEQVSHELRISAADLTELFAHDEIKNSTLVRVLGAIEIVRMRQNGEL